MSKYWGNRQWYWYHIMSYTSPEQIDIKNKKFYLELIYLMTMLLPCQKCNDHFTEYLKNTPVDFKSRDTMVKWFNTAHNFVNKSLNKPIISLEDSNKIYLKDSESTNLESDNLEILATNNETQNKTNNTNNTGNSNSNSNSNLKTINHSYLNEFIKYHAERGIYGHEPFYYVAKMIERLIIIYPCLQCKKVILDYNKKNPLSIHGKNIVTFRKWFYNFFNKQDLSTHFVYNWKNMS